MKRITSLSNEQIDKFPFYVKKWLDIGLNTDPVDINQVKSSVNLAYKNAGLPYPKLFIGPLNNPYEAAVAEVIFKEWATEKRKFSDEDELNNAILNEIPNQFKRVINTSSQIYGNHESWLSFYDFFQTECKLSCCDIIDGLKNLANVCGWWTPLADVVFIQHRPLEIHFDDRRRLHRIDGPAIKYRGSSFVDVYCVHGVRVPKKVIERNYTCDDIDNEPNVEIRRVMIELYGYEKYILDSKSEIISKDDFGTLYNKTLPNDEPVMVVEVVNSTPEPDGSFKNYFLRVDPKAYGGLKSGRAAVASTWRNKDGSLVFENPEEYDPEIQT